MQIDNIVKNKLVLVEGVWKTNHEILPTSKVEVRPALLLNSFDFSNLKILSINLVHNGYLSKLLKNKNSFVCLEEDPQDAKYLSSIIDQSCQLLICEKFSNLEFNVKFDLILLDSSKFEITNDIQVKLKSILASNGVFVIIVNNYNYSIINSFQHNYIYKLFPSAEKSNLIIEKEFFESNKVKEFLITQSENLKSNDCDNLVILYDNHSGFVNNLPKAIFYNTKRLPRWHTENLIYEQEGKIFIEKKLLNGCEIESKSLLSWQSSKEDWINEPSMLSVLESNSHKYTDYKKIFAPLQIWIDYLNTLTLENNLITGNVLDCLWSNSFIVNGKLKLIDQEWIYSKAVSLNVYFIRACYYFLLHITKQENCPELLKTSNWYRQIQKIANSVGLVLLDKDFLEFINLEGYIRSTVQGLNERTTKRNLKIQLNSYRLYLLLKALFSISKLRLK